jgi:hypothetical protein
MKTPQVIEEAFRALSTNRLRTSLTMLGVIIGVCAASGGAGNSVDG